MRIAVNRNISKFTLPLWHRRIFYKRKGSTARLVAIVSMLGLSAYGV